MIAVKCIQKFRDNNGKICGYRLIDLNGQTQDAHPETLKQAIRSNQIHVVNLTLTSDNRLIDTTEKQLQTNILGNSPIREFKIPKITDSRALLQVVQKYCATLRADKKGATYDGYRFHSACRGGSDYDDATTEVEVDDDKIIVKSHSCYGTDDKKLFTVNEIEEAFKYIKGTDAILTGMY